MFRKEIKVLDCTVRDGGLMNNWQFTDDFVKDVYNACVASGVDYMEIGYKSSEKAFSRDEVGAWKFCEEKDLRRIVGDNNTSLKLAAMADIGRIEPEDILPAEDSLLDMIRVAAYVHQTDKAIWLAEHCLDKGYEVTINLMAVSTVIERDLEEALIDLSKSRVPTIYLVDSFGSMYCEQIEDLVDKYQKFMPGKTLGVHMHNNMQLAFSNTITGIIKGCNMLDSTFLGIGRGAGNCPTEVLLSFLKNPKFKIKPILKVIQEHLIPMQKDIDWGYFMPYMITGALNQHPRSALKWMAGDKKDNYVAFYEQMTDKNDL
ncbi:MAG: aldolase catalytic domain-containing protein [Bacteroidales bacterium]|nr:aldolase catalytic domain-containing protein [Bacteroidales bacterium]MBN2820583.1 aldolase catalytic domain-containing protein [Bacteroidales bacterium]